MKSLLIYFFSILSINLYAQKFTISGYVFDAETGEKLIAANIYEHALKTGTLTNHYGFFSLTIPPATVNLSFSYIGYKTFIQSIVLDKDVELNIGLSPIIELQEVEIIAEERIEEKPQMSTVNIPIQQIKSMPALLGEVDVLKVLQLLPGIQSGNEGGSGLYVRGGGPDQNLILLDGVSVYNVSHLFGFFSVFNSDAIKSLQIIKGGFPARYGGRLSSVIDITMKEGNMKKFNVEGSTGIIASKLTVEGPIVQDKTSFIISARRTYIDILARPFMNKDNGVGGYYFYDFNAKLNHIFSDKDRLYFSIYMGDDKFYYKLKDEWVTDGVKHEQNLKGGLGWGNITSALRWNHILNKKLFCNTALTYSRYRFDLYVEYENITQYPAYTQKDYFFNKYFSGINDWSGKIDFDYMPVPWHTIKFGANAVYHSFNPGAIQYKVENPSSVPIDTLIKSSKTVAAQEYVLYFEDDIKFNNKLRGNLGIHSSGFNVENTFYYSVQPRLSLRYLLKNDWAIKTSYADMTQYIHLLSNGGLGMPTDLWVPATKRVEPQKSRQVAIGTAKTLFNDQYEFSIESYYKWMTGLIDYKGGANFLNPNSDWQDQIETNGKGWAYGTEFFIQRKRGKITGWIGYTLSWSLRQYEKINLGRVFPNKYDRRHDFSFVVSYIFNKNIDFSLTWVYGTGNATTLPIARYWGFDNYQYDMSGNTYHDEIYYYEGKNSFRMRAYHRLDIGADFHKIIKRGKIGLNFGVYNLYNRKNPFFIYFGYDKSGRKAFKQVSLFPVLPSLSFYFKF